MLIAAAPCAFAGELPPEQAASATAATVTPIAAVVRRAALVMVLVSFHVTRLGD